MLQAIVTLTPATPDLRGLRELLEEAALLGVARETPLVDGGHLRVADLGDEVRGDIGNNLGAVIAFVEKASALPDETPVEYGADLAIDLNVLSVGRISCGEHVGAMPENVIVTVHPTCTECAP